MKKLFINWKIRISVLLCCCVWVPAFILEAAVDPVVVELHYQNGVKFYKRGLYDKAVGEFERTLSLDPQHEEAKAYLEKIQKMDDKQKRVEAKKSQDVQIQELYCHGKELYKKHDFQGAKEVFEKILQLKPIDDFASFYREQCEIFIARQEAKDKKIEQKKLLKEKKIREKENRIKQKELDRERTRTLKADRVRIKEEHKQALKEEKQPCEDARKEVVTDKKTPEVEVEEAKGAQEAVGIAEVYAPDREQTLPQEAVIDQKKKLKEEKLAAASKRKEEKSAAAKKRREDAAVNKQIALQEKEKARQARILAVQEKKEKQSQAEEAKKSLAQQKQLEKNKPAKQGEEGQKQQVSEPPQAGEEGQTSVETGKTEEDAMAGKSAKDLYLEGAEHLGRKEYAEATQLFSAVIEKEKTGVIIYSNAAGRLMEKAKKELQGSSAQQKE